VSKRTDDAKQERRVLAFFAALAAVIVVTLAHGCYTGELVYHTGKGCVEDGCSPDY
jgi:hypothetical protein